MNICQILVNICRELLESTDGLTCEMEETKNSTVLTLISKNEQDVPRLIGKNGKTISALRVIMRAIYASKGNTNRLLITVKNS